MPNTTFDPSLGLGVCFWLFIIIAHITWISIQTRSVKPREWIVSRSLYRLTRNYFCLMLSWFVVQGAAAVWGFPGYPIESFPFDRASETPPRTYKFAITVTSFIAVPFFLALVVLFEAAMFSLVRRLLRAERSRFWSLRGYNLLWGRTGQKRRLLRERNAASAAAGTAGGLSAFIMMYPTLNYCLQHEAFTKLHFINELESGIATIRISSITVGAALLLSASRIIIDMCRLRESLEEIVHFRKSSFRLALSPLLDDAPSWKFTYTREFSRPFNQAVARTRFFQSLFFVTILIIFWLAFGFGITEFQVPLLSSLSTYILSQGIGAVPLVWVSVLLFFIVDDWYIVGPHLIQMKKSVTIYHRIRFATVFSVLSILAASCARNIYIYKSTTGLTVVDFLISFLVDNISFLLPVLLLYCQFSLWRLERMPSDTEGRWCNQK